MIKYLIIASWLACGFIASGFMNKAQDDGYQWTTKIKCEDWAARDQSFSIVWGILGGPITLTATMALTGFGHRGWSLNRRKCDGYYS